MNMNKKYVVILFNPEESIVSPVRKNGTIFNTLADAKMFLQNWMKSVAPNEEIDEFDTPEEKVRLYTLKSSNGFIGFIDAI